VYLAYLHRLVYLYVKNYQILWRSDEVLTKNWVLFWHTLYVGLLVEKIFCGFRLESCIM